jgi:hypothetical protein
MSAMSTISIAMPSGARRCAARSAMVLVELLRRLPEMATTWNVMGMS